jgi:hypothetical protein
MSRAEPTSTHAKPIVTFRASIHSTAAAPAVYELLANPAKAMVWAGELAPRKGFRLLSMDAASRPAAVGDTFASTGANINGTFHDRSTVVQADPPSRFGFDTESTLERRYAKTWHGRFAHRYTIEPDPGGSEITYTGELREGTYRPWWLKPGMRPMTMRNVQRMMRKHLQNLANLAAGAG